VQDETHPVRIDSDDVPDLFLEDLGARTLVRRKLNFTPPREGVAVVELQASRSLNS